MNLFYYHTFCVCGSCYCYKTRAMTDRVSKALSLHIKMYSRYIYLYTDGIDPFMYAIYGLFTQVLHICIIIKGQFYTKGAYSNLT